MVLSTMRRWLVATVILLSGEVTCLVSQNHRQSQSGEILPPGAGASSSAHVAQSDPQKQGQQSEIVGPKPFTSALLRISYDGTRFTGWSAANDGVGKEWTSMKPQSRPRSRGGRRIVDDDIGMRPGFVRSVEGVIRHNFAKLYGNVDPKRIVVEGCSRTDRGVHANGMIAQVYCLTEGVLEALEIAGNNDVFFSIPGKRKPHPLGPSDDSYFEAVPQKGSLPKVAYTLNRMRPADVQITGIAPTPVLPVDTDPFHPSLSCETKTYEYTICTGAFADPTQQNMEWFVGNPLDLSLITELCDELVGRHDFRAFQGAARGLSDKLKRQKQLTQSDGSVCVLERCELVIVDEPGPFYFDGVHPPIKRYRVVFVGNRFLYKMVRFLVGALVAVGKRKLTKTDVLDALDEGTWGDDRTEFECAPAHGLVLKTISYGDIPIEWQPLREGGTAVLMGVS